MGDADKLRQEVTDKLAEDEAARKAGEADAALEKATADREAAEAEYKHSVTVSATHEAAAKKALEAAQEAEDEAKKAAGEHKKPAAADKPAEEGKPADSKPSGKPSAGH